MIQLRKRMACLVLLFGLGQVTASLVSARSSPVTLPHTEQFDLRASSGLEYRIFLAKPRGEAPPAGWPVIYLSDGNGNFPVMLAAAQKQSRGGLQAVIVGIGYPSDDPEVHRARRGFDLTPVTSEEWMKDKAKGFAMAKTGGNDQFLVFINDELKPRIERQFKIDRTRQTLFGHSFGGLFALHVLFHKPESFQTYLASSPSLWWNDGSLREEERSFIEKQNGQFVRARVFVTVGEREQPSPIAGPAPSTSGPTQPSPHRDIVDRLNAAGITGLTAQFRQFAEETHGSVVLPAASRGAAWALEIVPRLK